MISGAHILGRLLGLFSLLFMAAIARGQPEVAILFALGIVFSLAAEALWLVNESPKAHR